VTNKPLDPTRYLLEHTDLAQYFRVVIGGDSTPFLKPHPEPILCACRQLGIPPAANLHIGDSCYDVGAARAAGCAIWLVPYGYTEDLPVSENAADAVVANLAVAWQRIQILQLVPGS
jgi:phosphoglycolate phosphatase